MSCSLPVRVSLVRRRLCAGLLAGASLPILSACDRTGSSDTMDHTALTYLFDPAGRIRVALRHEQIADDYAADVRRLLDESAL